jgi:hypothetical protein
MKAKELIKTDGIIKVSPEDTVANAVSQLHSSHDVAFVLHGKHYMGVIIHLSKITVLTVIL